MKQTLRFLLMGCAATLGIIACDKELQKGGEENQAARMEISLGKYYTETGSIGTRLWEKSDVVSLIDVDKNGSVTTGSPLSSGSYSSSFVFSLKGAEKGDILFAHMPASADIKFSNGTIEATVPTTQNGKVSPAYIGKTEYSGSVTTMSKMTMTTYWSTLYASLEKGNYSITKATVTGNSGEKIAGKLKINFEDYSTTASEGTVTVNFAEGLDCRDGAAKFPILLAPVTFEKGYTITYTLDNGAEIKYTCEDKTVCTMAGKTESGKAENNDATLLLFCGDNMIYLIDADLAKAKGYKNAIVWEWDAKSEAGTVGKGMIRLDDCKPVDNGTKILATSSQDYAVLVDYNTRKLLWHSNDSNNAHSADMLPGNRIAVACSDGGDCIQIFDANTSRKVLFSTPLVSAHGVVWNPDTERLYAIGGTTLNVYKLLDWNTASPKLGLEETINTGSHVKGLHDMTLVDGNTLLLAGNKAAFYNIAQRTFNNIVHFNGSTSLKAVNYNPETGECWYTDATGSDRELTWSSNDIRYTDDINTSGFKKNIWIGDINMYKVRVFKW